MTVELWWADLRADPGGLSCLTDAEQQRAARFVTDDLRRRFRNGRTILRLLLSRYAATKPESLEFVIMPYGKPALRSRASLSFNVSHSGEWFVCAVSRERRRLGVDIEVPRALPDALKISERFFSPAERARLAAFTGDEQNAAFFRCWTRKEAVIKATGFGLRLPLHSFDVSLEPPGDGSNLLRAARTASLQRRAWHLVDATRDPSIPCALAADAPIGEVRHIDWKPDSMSV